MVEKIIFDTCNGIWENYKKIVRFLYICVIIKGVEGMSWKL